MWVLLCEKVEKTNRKGEQYIFVYPLNDLGTSFKLSEIIARPPSWYFQWGIQDLPCVPTCYLAQFLEKLHENERIWIDKESVSGAGSATDFCCILLLIYNTVHLFSPMIL